MNTTIIEGKELSTENLSLSEMPRTLENNILHEHEEVEGKEKSAKPKAIIYSNTDDLNTITTINEDDTTTLYSFQHPVKYVDKKSSEINKLFSDDIFEYDINGVKSSVSSNIKGGTIK